MKAPDFWDKADWRGMALQPIAVLYGLIAETRLRRSPAGAVAIPVICVGNFTLGGAGKTPSVLMLAQMMQAIGHRTFILSRGYGARLSGPLLVDPNLHSARDVGDEPSLLARNFPVVIGADRLASAKLAIAHGASLLLMDDGLQNPRLKKSVNLAVVDGQSGVGNGRVFPAGPLRARLQAQLAITDAVLIIGDGERGGKLAEPAQALGCPVFRGRLVPDDEAHRLAGQQALAFCGIGRPEKFRRTLESVGIDVQGFFAFSDHHVITKHEADYLLHKAAREGLALVTTAKDQARLLGDPYTRQALAGLVNVVGVKLEIADTTAFKDWLLGRIKTTLT